MYKSLGERKLKSLHSIVKKTKEATQDSQEN